jgi:hypothetical protein
VNQQGSSAATAAFFNGIGAERTAGNSFFVPSQRRGPTKPLRPS